LGSSVSPSCRLASGRPTRSRLGKLVHTDRTLSGPVGHRSDLDAFLARQRTVKIPLPPHQDRGKTGPPQSGEMHGGVGPTWVGEVFRRCS
jgi:hypothetical protein